MKGSISKTILLILGFILILIITAGGIVFFRMDSILNSFEPRIETYLSKTLNAQIDFEDLSLAFLPEPHLSAKINKISFPTGSVMRASIKKVSLYPELIPLLKKQVILKGLSLDSLELELTPGTIKGVSKIGPLNVQLSGLIENDLAQGTLSAKGIFLPNVNATLDSKDLTFDLSTSLLTFKKLSINLTGTDLKTDGEFNFKTQSGNFVTDLDSSEINELFSTLRRFITSIKQYDLKGSASAKISANILNAELSNLTAEVTPKGLQVSGTPVAINIQKGTINYNQKANSKVATGSNIKLQLGSAKDTIQATFKADLIQNLINISIEASDLDLSELSTSSPLLTGLIKRYQISGKVSPNLQLTFANNSLFAGSGNINLKNASIDYDGILVKSINGSIVPKISPSNSSFNTDNLQFDLAGNKIISKGSYNLTEQSGKISIDATDLSLSELSKILAQKFTNFAKYSITGKSQANIVINFGRTLGIDGKLSLIESGVKSESFDISSISGPINLNSTNEGFKASSENINFRYQAENFSGAFASILDSHGFGIKFNNLLGLGGNLSGDFSLDKPAYSHFDTSFQARGFPLEKIKSLLGISDSHLTGGILNEFSGAFKGFLLPKLKAKGEASVLIVDTVLKGINIPKSVVDKLSTLPIIGGNLRQKIPTEFDPYFKPENTSIKSISGKIAAQDTDILLRGIKVQGDIFDMIGSGRIQNYNILFFDAIFLLDPKLSSLLVGKVQELSSLQDPQGRLEIPLIIKGPFKDLSIEPDTSRIVGKASQKLLEQGAGQLLENLLNRQNKNSSPTR